MAVDLVPDPRTEGAGEMRVETGFGRLDELGDNAGARNARVVIRAEHLTDPVVGWLDTTQGHLYEVAVDAVDHDRRVAYRIETHRKANVDPATPIAELGNREKVRDLVDLAIAPARGARRRQTENGSSPPGSSSSPANPSAGDSPATPSTSTPPAETEGSPGPLCERCGTPVELAADHPARRALDRGLNVKVSHDECPTAGGDVSIAEAGRRATTQREAHRRGETADLPPAGRREPVTGGARVQEARPWDEANSDGSPNRGSYEFAAAVDVAEQARYLWWQHATNPDPFGDDDDPPADPGPADWRAIQALARWLLRAADRTQAAVRTDGHADRMAASHTRARRAVRVALKAHPFPWAAAGAGDADVLDHWLGAVVDEAAAMLRVAANILEEPCP